MADKFPPAKGPKVPPMQPRITINIGESASSAQLRRLIRDRHAAWSQETFGDVGPVGPLKHLAKEALEAAAAPDDLSEWADLQFLLWDAQRRAGISDGEITAAMEEKLKVNMARQWPEPKDGEPRLHIKEQATPVVSFYRDGIEAAAKWVDQKREAYDDEYGRHDPDTGFFEFGNDSQREYSDTLVEIAEGIRSLHPNTGSHPVFTDSWIECGERMPEKYGKYLVASSFGIVTAWFDPAWSNKFQDCDTNCDEGMEDFEGKIFSVTHWQPLPAIPQQGVKNG
ncbi:DUF550 domain-containing protein [Citrobacter freundii]|nr:dATP/dGTP pyrophosphohydrolase domain-containing protein [Citrobacter freundii]MDT3759946.1 DUF550 domain-containing protein [Citrobacter freundii complex sp. 2023EL-00962]EJA2536308.1 DUF550 domain-containing protein [Citrobacter freundii]EJG2392152.1 DUF550 domain-containing protein [Citrobacter freundii]EKN0241776.1 DUF550 domain-containing protein [Citrobacter freundii]EKU3728021.1 DUF550 domain-containing protein [Citrobacter freundii]